MNKQAFDVFLSLREREVIAGLDRSNPYKWKKVIYIAAFGIGMICVDLVIETGAAGPVGALVLIADLFLAVSTLWTRDSYVDVLHTLQNFHTMCWEASKLYDYSLFERFVRTKLLKLF